MQSETADYTLPKNAPVIPGNDSPQTERQRLERKAWQEQLQAEERERMRPVEEAERAIKETHRQIAKVQRDTLLNERVEDQDLFISPEVMGASMPQTQADAWNLEQWRQFHAKYPAFHPSSNNVGLLHEYHLRNHCGIYTSEMLCRVYDRMVAAGVEFEQAPPPAPETTLPLPNDRRPKANVRIAPAKVETPPTYEGWDPETGEARTYSQFEVSRMSSEEMRRRLRLTREKLSLPNTGPGTLLRPQREHLQN